MTTILQVTYIKTLFGSVIHFLKSFTFFKKLIKFFSFIKWFNHVLHIVFINILWIIFVQLEKDAFRKVKIIGKAVIITKAIYKIRTQRTNVYH